MEYYSILPKEARLQLLIEADYPTILELCQDPLFEDICNSNVLWEEKLKKDFNITSDNPKDTYAARYRMLVRQQIKDKQEKLRLINVDAGKELFPLTKERDNKIKELEVELRRMRKEYENKINEAVEKFYLKAGYYDYKEEINKLQNFLSDIADDDSDLSVLKIRNPNRIDFLNEFMNFGVESISTRNGITSVRFSDYRDAQEVKRLYKDKYEFI